MKRVWSEGVAMGLLVTLACSDDGGLAGPVEPSIEFQVAAPTTSDGKAQISITARVTQAKGVEYPLTVFFEKSNAGEGFNGEGSFLLVTPADVIATLRTPARQDPRYRITITESGARAFSVSKTIGPIDVLDFP